MTLVLLLMAAAAGAGQQAITRANAARAADQQIAAVMAAHARADAALADLAASERAYVAPGQGMEFWAGKVDEALASARAAVSAIPAPEALSRLDDFASMDQRARDFVARGQRSFAADLIFVDGYEIIAAARADAASAASAARGDLAASATRASQLHLAAVSGLGACALIALLLLLRSPKPAEPMVSAIETAPLVMPSARAEASDDAIGAALDASLESLSAPDPQPLDTIAGADTPAVRLPASASAPAAVDLGSAADVCVDLARLLDARDLQSVLSRIAEVLGADGVIVWMADAAGGTLSPALTHGYKASLLARLGPLPVDEDNATSAAWRSRSLQLVGGALAVPMLTSDGCTGVLAVEFRSGQERASDVQSLARILAAQLAATISSPAPEARRAAEA